MVSMKYIIASVSILFASDILCSKEKLSLALHCLENQELDIRWNENKCKISELRQRKLLKKQTKRQLQLRLKEYNVPRGRMQNNS